MLDFGSKKEHNTVEVDGVVFKHDLSARTSKDGAEYITGTVHILADEEGLNAIPVNFGFVRKYFNPKQGESEPRENQTYTLLEKLMQKNNVAEKVGRDEAMVMRAQCEIECNDFIASNGDEVAQQRIRGNWAHEGSRGDAKAEFAADMLISNYFEDDGRGTIRGYVFNYRNDFMPVTFNVRIPEGMKYFSDTDPSNDEPLLTHVWGNIVNTTVEVEEKGAAAFGEVRVTPRSFRSWDIAGASGEPYDFGDEDVMTFEDIKKGMADRATKLAEIKANWEERQKSNSGSAFSANKAEFSPTSKTNFRF